MRAPGGGMEMGRCFIAAAEDGGGGKERSNALCMRAFVSGSLCVNADA
jgi:hypothetical protein